MARAIADEPDTAWWVRWHHERFDGTGYPDGLVGDEIPLPARILAVADAFEAITHARPYRQALDPQDALTELRGLAGLHYDPRLIALFTDKVFPALTEGRQATETAG
ncbi:Cyclic di-GMP phosphodiesterase response regulator RpfG [compost metagenome]